MTSSQHRAQIENTCNFLAVDDPTTIRNGPRVHVDLKLQPELRQAVRPTIQYQYRTRAKTSLQPDSQRTDVSIPATCPTMPKCQQWIDVAKYRDRDVHEIFFQEACSSSRQVSRNETATNATTMDGQRATAVRP